MLALIWSICFCSDARDTFVKDVIDQSGDMMKRYLEGLWKDVQDREEQ